MSLTASDVVVIIFSTLLSFITILLVIWEAEEQMFAFGLRPSESLSSNIAGLLTIVKGISGNGRISYSNSTSEILYNITINKNLVCVKSTLKYTSTDCSAFPLKVEEPQESNGSGFNLLIEKNDNSVSVELKS